MVAAAAARGPLAGGNRAEEPPAQRAGALHTLQQRVQGQRLIEGMLLQRGLGLLFGEAHVDNLLDLLIIGRLVLRGKGLGPVLGGLGEELTVVLVHLGDLGVLWVIRLRSREQCLDREERRADRQRGAPLLPQYVEADCAGLRRDVRVPNLRVKLHLRRVVRVVRWDLDVDVEPSPAVGRRVGAPEASLPVREVAAHRICGHGGVLRQCANVHQLFLQPLQLPRSNCLGRHSAR
mmetsp:Transcript_44892/g.100923  ORF Transcript_44892/g.100923 Transcript_44892/m.100923 type:complete len:234 (-) Transcript_44892:63-764(-)